MATFKPCPFCGDTDMEIKTTTARSTMADRPHINIEGAEVSVRCIACNLVMTVHNREIVDVHRGRERLIERWNRRVAE